MSEIKTEPIKIDEHYLITEDMTFADIIRWLSDLGCDKQEAMTHYDHIEKELLEDIFGKIEEGSEAHYGQVMRKAGELYLKQLQSGDPYAFHKAFEKAYEEAKEYNMLP